MLGILLVLEPLAHENFSITGVILNSFSMTDAEAKIIAEVLASPDPTKFLLDQQTSDGGALHVEGAGVTGMLKRGTQVTLLPMGADEAIPDASTRWTLATDVCSVRIIPDSDVQNEATVLVPGYGLFKVSRDQVVPTDAAARSVGGVTSQTILSSSRRREARNGLRRFIQLVGPLLTQLSPTLRSSVESLVPIILRSCPNLKVLTVKGGSIITRAFLKRTRKTTRLLRSSTATSTASVGL